jgi:hypothetical protein
MDGKEFNSMEMELELDIGITIPSLARHYHPFFPFLKFRAFTSAFDHQRRQLKQKSRIKFGFATVQRISQRTRETPF